MIKYEEWKDKRENFFKVDVRHVQGNFFPGLRARAAALKVGEGLGRIAADFWQLTWQSRNRTLPYEIRLLLSLTNAVGAGRMRQAARELVKAYIYGLESAALDDVFELLAWNQGIGFFSSEIGPSPLFQAYKLIKTQEQRGKSRDEIYAELKEKFGEKNQEVQVL